MNPDKEILEKVRKNKLKKLGKLKFFIDVISLLIIFTALIAFGIMFFVVPKKETSEIEQRNLAKMPEFSIENVWNGNFTSGMNIYYSDNVAYRDSLVKAQFAIEDNRGIRVDSIRIYGSEGTEIKGGYEDMQTFGNNTRVSIGKLLELKASEPGKESEKIDLTNPYYTDPNKHFEIFDKDSLNDKFSDYLNIDKNELAGEQRGNLFVVGDAALEIFYGNEKVSKDYAEVINAYAEALGDTVTVYNMIVPNHFEYGLPEKYKDKIGRPQKPFIDLVKDNLNDSVVFVDIYNTLKEHYDNGEYLYFRTDHHWTGLGAYRAYEKFCENAALTPIPLESYEKRTSTGFLGTLYSSSMDKNLAANPDTVEYYVTDLPYEQQNYSKDGKPSYKGTLISEFKNGRTNGYLTFMGGDIPLAEIKTQNTNGRKMIVFKESYGNAFAPFLVPHYETVYVADIRSFPFNAIDFIKENGIGEVLFINNIMASNTSARVANILSLMTK